MALDCYDKPCSHLHKRCISKICFSSNAGVGNRNKGGAGDKDVLSRTDSVTIHMHANKMRPEGSVNILHAACESKNSKCVEFLIDEIMAARYVYRSKWMYVY